MKNKTIFLLVTVSISIITSISAEQNTIRESDYKERIKAMSLFFPSLIPDSAEHVKIKDKDYEAVKTLGAALLFWPSCSPELLEAEKSLEKRNVAEKRNPEKWYNKITINNVANIGIDIGIIVLSFIPGILLCGGIEHLKAHYHFAPLAPQPEGFVPDQGVA